MSNPNPVDIRQHHSSCPTPHLPPLRGSGLFHRLDTQEQALILGHAVPMPVVVQTRRYDSDFYRAMGAREPAELAERLADNVHAMRPPKEFEGFD